MDRLSEQGGASVVFVGTSMARDGLDPVIFLEANRSFTSAYNAALSNASPIIMEDWLTREVVPRLHPDLVVWGLESFVLNDSAPTLRKSIDFYQAAPRSKRDPASEIETWLDDHLYLFRYQQVLQRPGEVFRAIRGMTPQPEKTDIPFQMNALGRTTGRVNASFADVNTEAQGARLRDGVFVDFTIGGPQLLALRTTVEWLQEREIDVAFVLMPALPQYLALHRSESDYQLFVEQTYSLAQSENVPVFAPNGPYTQAEFADLLHLNGEGAEKFTMEVSKWLSDLTDHGDFLGLQVGLGSGGGQGPSGPGLSIRFHDIRESHPTHLPMG
jgi:hypothetical protein